MKIYISKIRVLWVVMLYRVVNTSSRLKGS